MSRPRARSALHELRPTPGRLLGALATAAVVVGLGWFVGIEPGRVAGLAVAGAALVLLARVAPPVEASWPDAPGRRTRPGWHVVATTQRLLTSARTDRDDRAVVAARLDRLAGTGGHDPRVDAARRAVGLRDAPGRPRTDAPRADRPPPHGRSS